jgi:hypothetical protein
MPVHVPRDLPEASPMIISESETHITIVFKISKATLFRHPRFLQALLDAAIRGQPQG